MLEKQKTKNKILAAHLGGGLGGQGGAQQGTGARGEQYLDGLARSHTIAAWILFGTSRAPKQIPQNRNQKISLTDRPSFEASARWIVLEDWNEEKYYASLENLLKAANMKMSEIDKIFGATNSVSNP